MIRYFVALALLFALKAQAKPECSNESVSKSVQSALLVTKEGQGLPTIKLTRSALLNRSEIIKNARSTQGKNFIQFKGEFQDGSDFEMNFMLSDIGQRNFQKVRNLIGGKTKRTFTEGQFTKLLHALPMLAIQADHLDEETELGSTVPFELCTLILEAKVSGAKYCETCI